MALYSYCYETAEGKATGAFNIYQGRDGGIYLLMGSNVTALTLKQVSDLHIHVHALKDYDQDEFDRFYKLPAENIYHA